MDDKVLKPYKYGRYGWVILTEIVRGLYKNLSVMYITKFYVATSESSRVEVLNLVCMHGSTKIYSNRPFRFCPHLVCECIIDSFTAFGVAGYSFQLMSMHTYRTSLGYVTVLQHVSSSGSIHSRGDLTYFRHLH